MKSLHSLLTAGLLALAFTAGARAQAFYGSDNFDDNTFASGRWGAFGTNGGGLWSEQNGRMEFTGDASSTTYTTSNRVSQFRLWSNNTPNTSYSDDWTATASFTIDNSAVASNGVVLMGLETFATATDAGYYGIYLTSATSGARIFTERGIWNGTGYDRTFIGSTGNLDVSFDVTDVLLRISYDAGTQTLTSSFSFDSGASYIDYASGGTGHYGASAAFGIDGWSDTVVDGFGMDIYGALYGNGTDTGPTLLSGQAYMDNLSVSAVPEPSTYAAIAGALMLGFAAWRRRAKAA